MIDHEPDRLMLSRLVGSWQGTLLHRVAADEPFLEMPGTSENRWVLGGRFVEMTLRAGDSWSALFYIGYERTERRHVLVSLEAGARRVTTRSGEWSSERDRLVLTSQRAQTICNLATPGELRLELSEEIAPGNEFVRFKAEYRLVVTPEVIAKPSPPRPQRRFVIA